MAELLVVKMAVRMAEQKAADLVELTVDSTVDQRVRHLAEPRAVKMAGRSVVWMAVKWVA